MNHEIQRAQIEMLRTRFKCLLFKFSAQPSKFQTDTCIQHIYKEDKRNKHDTRKNPAATNNGRARFWLKMKEGGGREMQNLTLSIEVDSAEKVAWGTESPAHCDGRERLKTKMMTNFQEVFQSD